MGKFKNFYNTPEWKQLRNQKWKDANGLCERCLSKGIVREGKEVHHIIPLDQDWDKRLDYDNLILLCSDCHNEVHKRISPMQEFDLFWDNMEDDDK